MARINRPLTLRHRANLGEEARTVEFEQGEEVEILECWAEHYLCRNRDGWLFNVAKEHVDPGAEG